MSKIKIVVVLLLAVFYCLESYAQPANNTCTGAIAVPLDGSCTTGTTVSATVNWGDTVACQASNSNPEVWYSFTADSNNISISITEVTMTGDIEFILVEQTFIPCFGPFPLQASSCGPSVLTDTITALTIGQDYLFTISSSTGGDGTFDVCITSFNFPPISASDCDSAVNVCTNFGFQIQPDGFGLVMEIPPLGSVGNPDNANPGGSGNFGCLRASPPERNSTWMIVNIDNSGLLEFTFGGNGTQSGFYDWIMYPWNPNVCTDIPTGNYAPVRCNWNGVNFGGTGLASTVPVGGDASNYEPPLPVVCGEKYIIVFSNWSSVVTGVPLDFGGTASVTCFPEDLTIMVIPPNPVICPGGSITLTASGADTYTWSPAAGLSDTTGTSVIASPAVTTTYAVRGLTGCFSGDTTITVVVQPLNAGFTFTGSQCLSTNNIIFTNTGAPVGSCGANCPTFTWDFGDGTGTTGTDAAAASPTHTYTSGGTFTVTQIVDDSVCVAIYSMDITISNPTSTIVGTEESCFGGCDGAADLTVLGGVIPYTYAWSSGPATEDIIDVCDGTYIVTATDAFGCTISDTVTLNPIVDVIAGFTYNSNQCLAGNNFIFTNNGDAPGSCGSNCPLFWWDFGDGNTSSGTNASAANPSHIYLTTGTYTVTQVITDGSGCTDTVTQNIVVFDAPVASIVGVDESCIGACDGSAALTLTGGAPIAIYSWSNSASTQNITGLCGGDYSVIVTDTNGCQDSANVTINIGTEIKAGFTHNGNQCLSGNSFVFTNTGSLPGVCGGGCPTYTWDFGDFTVISGTTPSDANPTHTYSSDGTFMVMQIVNNGLCSDTLIQIIVVSPEPTITIVPTDVSCGACDGMANLTVTSGTAPFTYNWSNFETAQDLNGVCAGTYMVTVTDSNGCTVTDSVVITQGAGGLFTSVSKTDVSCYGGNDGTATVTLSGGTPPFTYTWSNGDTLATADSLTADTFSVVVADSSGCIDTIDITISEPPALILTMDTVGATCGVADGIASVNVSGGTSPYTYLWDDFLAQTTDIATGLFAGVYQVIVTDSAGCADSASAIVNNVGAPTLTISSSDVKCNGGNDGQAVVIVSTGTAPFTYLWNDPAAQITDTAVGLIAGFYSVTVTDAGGCIGIDTITISEPPILTSSISSIIHINCYGDSTGEAIVLPAGGTLPYTYSWNSVPVQTTDTAIGLIAGTYTVTVTDTNGCSTSASATVTQPAAALTASITSSTNVSCNGLCDGDATVTVSGGTPPFTYLWDDPNNQTNATATGLCAGNYIAIITDFKGCSDTVNIQITEPPVIILSIAGTNASCKWFCNGSSTVITTSNTTYTYLWDDPLAQTDSTATGLCVGTYSVTVTDTGTNCFENISYTILQDPWAPVADFSLFPNPTTIFEPTITFTNLSFPDIDSLTYQWDFGDGEIYLGLDTAHTYADTGTFIVQLIVFDSDGCPDTTTQTLIIKGEYIVFVPSSFSPNKDGINDLFFPKGIGLDNNNFEMYIFDRWGDEIFRTTDFSQGWDGRANNGREIAQQDVYIWLILAKDVDGKRHRYIGHVTLVR